MNKKLYVGGLPYSTTEEELKVAFAPFGTVASVRILNDKFTGKSRGFGFVEMGSEEEAQSAIQGMNSKEFGGRTLLVNESRPEQPRQQRSFGGGYGGGYNDGGAGSFGGRSDPANGRRGRGDRGRDGGHRRDRSGNNGDGGGNRW